MKTYSMWIYQNQSCFRSSYTWLAFFLLFKGGFFDDICDTDLVNKLTLQMYTLHKYR